MSEHSRSSPLGLDSHAHDHEGVKEISWSRLGGLLRKLAWEVIRCYRPDLVIGIAKGGVIPAVFLSSAFLVDFFPIKLSSRHNEQVVARTPVWYVHPTSGVTGKRVLLVDDICITGLTLRMASEEIMLSGAREIRTAALAVHSVSARPDYVALDTDALVVWPWDRETLAQDGTWAVNAEYKKLLDMVIGLGEGCG
jgi:hypoxanthine phosphoribosyltransferase